MAENTRQSENLPPFSVKNTVNNTTAKICYDYQLQASILTKPEPRRAWARLVVVLATAAMALWAVVYIASTHTSGVDIKKVKHKPLAYAKQRFPALPAGSILKAAPQRSPDFTCPCDLVPSTFPWCQFINFSIIVCNQKTNNVPKATMVSTTNCERPSDPTSLCQDFEGPNIEACVNALHNIFDFIHSYQMSHIDTPNLSTSLDVHYRVAQQMQANIDTRNQTVRGWNQPQDVSNDTVFDPAISYDATMLSLLLLQSMVLQVFDCKTDSTAQEFWDRGITCGWNLYPKMGDRMNGNKFVFGMSMDYDAYSNRCQPPYCYMYEDDNLSKRFMNAFAEVGGAANLILLGIRLILWPLVATILCFPHAPSINPNNDVVSGITNIITGPNT